MRSYTLVFQITSIQQLTVQLFPKMAHVFQFLQIVLLLIVFLQNFYTWSSRPKYPAAEYLGFATFLVISYGNLYINKQQSVIFQEQISNQINILKRKNLKEFT